MPGRVSTTMEALDDVPSSPISDAPAALSVDENATNRRKSGRVSKKPAVYSPPPMVSQNGTHGKRKRVAEDGEAGDDGDGASVEGSDEEEEDEEESESEPDEEEVKAKKKRSAVAKKAHAKPAAKKPKTKASVGGKTLAVRSAFTRPPPRARGPRTAQDDETEMEGLYGEWDPRTEEIAYSCRGFALTQIVLQPRSSHHTPMRPTRSRRSGSRDMSRTMPRPSGT